MIQQKHLLISLSLSLAQRGTNLHGLAGSDLDMSSRKQGTYFRKKFEPASPPPFGCRVSVQVSASFTDARGEEFVMGPPLAPEARLGRGSRYRKIAHAV